MREAKIMSVAAEVVRDEEVLVAGVFQPEGTLEAVVATGVASTAARAAGTPVPGLQLSGLAAGRVAAEVQEVPRWTIAAVTPAKVHLLSARSAMNLTLSDPKPFAQIDRANLELATSRIGGILRVRFLDRATNRMYKLECSAAGSLGRGGLVLDELEKQPG